MFESLLGLGASAVSAARSFSFIARERADRKKAESAALRNSLMLPMDNMLRDLAREARDDPRSFDEQSDKQLERWRKEWQDNETLTQTDRDRLFGHALGLQKSGRTAIAKRYEQRNEGERVAEAELAWARQQSSLLTVSALLASDNLQEQALGARKMAEMRDALFDPQGPAMSQGPKAVALRWHAMETEVDRGVISSMALRKMGGGGDPSAIIAALRGQGTADSLRDGTFGIAARSGLRYGGRLTADEAWSLADELEQSWSDEMARREASQKVAADEALESRYDSYTSLRDAYLGKQIDAATVEREGALFLTAAQVQGILADPGAPTQSQREWLADNRRDFERDLDAVEIGASGSFEGFETLKRRVDEWQDRGLVSADQARELRGDVTRRMDQHAEQYGQPLTPGRAASKYMTRLKSSLDAASSMSSTDIALYDRQLKEWGSPGGNVAVMGAEPDMMSDHQRQAEIWAAAETARQAGVDPQDVFHLGMASLHAGGNGRFLDYVAQHGGADGVAGAQRLLREQPDTWISMFPNVAAHRDRLAFAQGGQLDVSASVKGINDSVHNRVAAETPRRTGQFSRGEAPPMRAVTPDDYTPSEIYLLDWLMETYEMMGYRAQPSQKQLAERAKAERELMAEEHAP